MTSFDNIRSTHHTIVNSQLAQLAVEPFILCYVIYVLIFLAEASPTEKGVFTSLQSRYFAEYAAVLEKSRSQVDRDPHTFLALIRVEVFAVQQCADFKMATLQLGLIERIEALPDHRYGPVNIQTIATSCIEKWPLLLRTIELYSVT